MRKVLFATAALLAASVAYAQNSGTADEALAMIKGAAKALAADKASALAAFTAGKAPFKEKDLYVFCGDTSGKYTAHGAKADLVGKSMRDGADAAGMKVGEALYSTAVAGEYKTVEYMWPRPGATEPSKKVSYVTKVGDQICGVGYYK